ncbi:hypothetical protein ACFORL_06210 [Legionella dresdenensis]|uniref:Lpg0393-like VPS9-like domain-containing protein n=1 Tax=Legionella dresdenensis TaxID=450200 RepID=A0ABV8CES4_9GAMM
MNTREFLSYVKKKDYFCITEWVNDLSARYQFDNLSEKGKSYLMCHELIMNDFTIADIPDIRILTAVRTNCVLNTNLNAKVMNFIDAGLIFATLHHSGKLEEYRARKYQASVDIVSSLDSIINKKLFDSFKKENDSFAKAEKEAITSFRHEAAKLIAWKKTAEALKQLLLQGGEKAAARLGVLDSLTDLINCEPILTPRIANVVNQRIATIMGLEPAKEEKTYLDRLIITEKKSLVSWVRAFLWSNVIDIKPDTPKDASYKPQQPV